MEHLKLYASHGVQTYPRLSAIIFLSILTLLATRIFTTVRFYLQRKRVAKASHPISPPVPPYSIPWIANGSYYLDLVPNIRRLAHRFPDMTAFTFRIAGSKHHVIMAPSMVRQMMTSKTHIAKFTMRPFIFRTLENVWGDDKKLIRNMDPGKVDAIHDFLSTMMHSSFLNVNLPSLLGGLSTKAADFVTFSKSDADLELWERASATVTTSPDTAVTSMFDLVRTFSAVLTTDIFFSPDLLCNYPDIITDLYHMDTKFDLFFAGFPQWIPSNVAAARARDRVVEQMRQATIAFNTWDQGKDPGPQWSRIGETNSAMAGRVRGAAAVGDFDESLPEKDRGRVATLCQAAILWALQVNAPGVIFWLLFYAYSDPVLLQQLRDEIAPYIKIADSSREDGAADQTNSKPKLDIDGAGLRVNAKLLTSAFNEVMRMETFSMTYKLILEDIVVNETPDDAAIFQRPDDAKAFILNKGDYVVVPHTLHHYDPRYFPDPERFDARRFWVPSSSYSSSKKTNEDGFKPDLDERGLLLDPSQVEVTYRTAHPWGGGLQLCKGKKFAEHEVLYIAAALLYLWDLTPVKTDSEGHETEVPWQHPGRANLSATARPATDVRVKVTRRKGLW